MRVFNRRRVVGAGLGVLTAATMVGCDDSKNRVALLEQENQELRGRNSQLEAQLGEANSQRSLLEEERATLQSELSNRTPAGGATGFEGIEGVDSMNLASGGVKLDVAGDILFDSGKATLRDTARSTLDQIAGVLQSQYAGRMIRIEGHTDSDPIKKSGWKTNERLGAERALAVEEFLASKGVPNGEMYIASFGPSQPKGTKKDSRRVEILIYAQ